MNHIKKDFMYFACLIVCSVAQDSYASQNYHGIVRRDNNNTSAGIPLTQYLHNKWDAIKKDHQAHYSRIGNAHLQAGQLMNTDTSARKK